MSRVVSYVDGYNLYYGLRDARLKRLYWLDLVALSQNLLKPWQTLEHTHYFTSRIHLGSRNSDDVDRQSLYLDALATRPGLTIHEGHFLQKEACCRGCGSTWRTYEEKMTDVNIAVQLLVDAYTDRFDTAFLISADSDLVTPIRQVGALFPDKRVVVMFPPRRSSFELINNASAYFQIGEMRLKQSQLPEVVVTAAGVELQRPESWR